MTEKNIFVYKLFVVVKYFEFPPHPLIFLFLSPNFSYQMKHNQLVTYLTLVTVIPKLIQH